MRASTSTGCYAVGLIMGGGMAYQLGCNAADIIAGIAPSAFDLLVESEQPCHPTRPVTVMSFRGTADTLVLYDGGTVSPPNGLNVTMTLLGAVGTFQRWAERRNFQLRARDNRGMDHRRRIVLRVDSCRKRSIHNGFAQVSLGIGQARPLLNSLAQIPSGDVNVLSSSRKTTAMPVSWHNGISSRAAISAFSSNLRSTVRAEGDSSRFTRPS